LRERPACDQKIDWPPSIESTWPVTHDASLGDEEEDAVRDVLRVPSRRVAIDSRQALLPLLAVALELRDRGGIREHEPGAIELTVMPLRPELVRCRVRGEASASPASRLAEREGRAQIALHAPTAHELGPYGITVNSIAPGFVLSNPTSIAQFESYGEERQQRLLESIATRRLGTRRTSRNGVLFFVSEEASW